MSESGNTLFAAVLGNAGALGNLTTTNAVTDSFAGAGFAVGFAAATAAAVGTTAAAPQTDATTDGVANGGSTTTSYARICRSTFPMGQPQSRSRPP